MCAPVVLSDAVIGLATAHIIGFGLIAGLVVFNSNGVRKGMSSMLGIPGTIAKAGEKGMSRVIR
jgi:hypothetical protein